MTNYWLEHGDRWAEIYDSYIGAGDALDVVAFVERSGSEEVLEFGIGTGRLAIPLQMKGVQVHGIEISPHMVEVLRTKPGGQNIPVTMGDFCDVLVDKLFPLVLIPLHTVFALTSQQRQIDCLTNAARHLTQGGVVALQAFVPDATRFSNDTKTEPLTLEDDRVMLDVALHTAAFQRVDSVHIVFEPQRTRFLRGALRYASPGELDLMARLAGLQLRARSEDWKGTPFSVRSEAHVSLYEAIG